MRMARAKPLETLETLEKSAGTLRNQHNSVPIIYFLPSSQTQRARRNALEHFENSWQTPSDALHAMIKPSLPQSDLKCLQQPGATR